MTINTNQHSVQNLFEKHATFQVPKYQREYAWDESAIDDFIQDISKCLLSRKTGGKRSHFFGGVVTTKVDIPPSSRQNFEVIDGQQRLASFTMLVAAVIQCAERRVSELSKKAALSNAEKKAKKYFEDTVKDLKSKYLLYRDSINLEYVDVSRLKLSNADDAYFQDLINEKNPEAKRDSHKRIFEAWTRLNNFVESEVIASGDPLEQAQCMGLLVSGVLAEDCTIIFMWSDERTEAFQIFQVLNDRGVNLTDGDLLRAKTMELLDTKAHKKIQEAVSLLWDEILSYPPKDIDDYLRWYFSSVEGTRPNSANLADQFLKERFKCHDKDALTSNEAKGLENEVRNIRNELIILDNLKNGIWPYPNKGKTVAWDWSRLPMLVQHLKHTNAMPLLLAMTKLDVEKFAEALCSLERFVFRYKIIGNAHITPATALYHQHATEIRKNPTTYKISSLRHSLDTLSKKYVPDKIFETLLREKKYATASGNGYLRYLFITLEDYYSWYSKGGNGTPRCQEKSHILDFSLITIEHIYPQNADAKIKDKKIEDIKHSIGNLTIFSPADQIVADNKPFSEKIKVFQNSKLSTNKNIAKNTSWTVDLINKRCDEIIKMALNIFVP